MFLGPPPPCFYHIESFVADVVVSRTQHQPPQGDHVDDASAIYPRILHQIRGCSFAVLSPVKVENPLHNRIVFLERLTLDPKVNEQAPGRAMSFIYRMYCITAE